MNIQFLHLQSLLSNEGDIIFESWNRQELGQEVSFVKNKRGRSLYDDPNTLTV